MGLGSIYKHGGSQLEQAFTGFIEQAGKMGVMFEETDDSNLGIEMVKQADYSCYVLLKDNPRVIRLYKNNRYNFEANLVETLLNAFVERYNAISEIARENPLRWRMLWMKPIKNFIILNLWMESESLLQPIIIPWLS